MGTGVGDEKSSPALVPCVVLANKTAKTQEKVSRNLKKLNSKPEERLTKLRKSKEKLAETGKNRS